MPCQCKMFSRGLLLLAWVLSVGVARAQEPAQQPPAAVSDPDKKPTADEKISTGPPPQETSVVQKLEHKPNPLVPTPQTDAASTRASASEAQPVSTMFPHPDGTLWWVSGQANIIFQAHPGFHSPYQGVNSFRNAGEYKTSLLGSLYLGARVYHSTHTNTEFFYHEESTGGRGLGQALGLAGFTNLDVVRNPSLGSVPYTARMEIHETIGFGSQQEDMTDERGPFSLATSAPVRRFDFRAGKLSTVDNFDVNGVGSDSHLQFADWAVDNNAAYDYAADTRGYTYGALLEYHDKAWSARYGVMLMPTVANGVTLDWALRRARGEQAEEEVRHSLIQGRNGTTRFLEYWNHAHMGDYRQSVQEYLADPAAFPSGPVIQATEKFGAVKYGFGVNNEQEITDYLRLFGRFGWNEGQHESFAYTEVDQTWLFGGDYRGDQWGRKQDKFGIAYVTDAIKKDHQNYLALGGLGFLLGDGRLHYAREDIVEAYYNAHAYRGLYFALQQFYIGHPGYNLDRGPVYVGGVRAHVDF